MKNKVKSIILSAVILCSLTVSSSSCVGSRGLGFTNDKPGRGKNHTNDRGRGNRKTNDKGDYPTKSFN